MERGKRRKKVDGAFDQILLTHHCGGSAPCLPHFRNALAFLGHRKYSLRSGTNALFILQIHKAFLLYKASICGYFYSLSQVIIIQVRLSCLLTSS